MDRASSLIFPGSKTLAGWWRQLAPHQPTALAIGYAFLHRIEAPVHVHCDQELDPLAHFVLQALSLSDADLAGRLHLPAPALQTVLIQLQSENLAARTSNAWQLTERGHAALQAGTIPVHVIQRRVFPFLERLDSSGARVSEPCFVPLSECVSVPWPVDEAHHIEIGELRKIASQSVEWKKANGFPLDVEAFADASSLDVTQQVIVDRPERVMIVLISIAAHEVLGFAVKAESWTLFDRTPVVRMPSASESLWSASVQAPKTEVWQESWRSWCKQRQLPTNEVEICALNYRPPRLEVQAPARLVQRLQAAKSDLFKGEAWLLAGDGYIRTAAQLAIRS